MAERHEDDWHCGVEGPTDDPTVERLRTRQVKNCFTLTLLALGVPMLLMGDEVRRTQRGNNNAYCQDNAISWLDWTLLEQHRDLHRFVKLLIAHRLHVVRLMPTRDVCLDKTRRRTEGDLATMTILAAFGRPREPPVCFFGGVCPEVSQGFSTCAVTTGYEVRRLTLSRDKLRKHSPGTAFP